MRTSTISEYKNIINSCKDIYLKKSKDYGSAWRILRLPSITDQIFIKAQRIRTIQEKNLMKVDEGIENEFIGIIKAAKDKFIFRQPKIFTRQHDLRRKICRVINLKAWEIDNFLSIIFLVFCRNNDRVCY